MSGSKVLYSKRIFSCWLTSPCSPLPSTQAMRRPFAVCIEATACAAPRLGSEPSISSLSSSAVASGHLLWCLSDAASPMCCRPPIDFGDPYLPFLHPANNPLWPNLPSLASARLRKASVALGLSPRAREFVNGFQVVSPYRQALSFSPATCLGCSLCKERGCGREWHRSLRGRDFFSLQALPRALGFIGILSDPAPPRASGGLCQQCYPRVLGAPPCASILASICLPVPAMTGEPGLKCFLRS